MSVRTRVPARPGTGTLRRRVVLWAAALGTAVALVQAFVVHAVIDSTAETAIAERIESYTVWSSTAAGIAMVALATGLAAWASKRVLEPVAEMARTAADWSEHALDRRFDLGPPTDEIRALGKTLDRLLDKVSRVILGEQRLTSELAHELRTPLAAIRATADLVAMRPDLDDDLRADVADILAACTAMADTMTGLLDLARATGPGRGENAVLRDVVAAALASVDGERVHVTIDPDLVVAVPTALGARALAPVLDNASRLAGHVTVVAARRGGWVDVSVCDDGPGVPAAVAETVFDPGRSGRGGSGLGLALARRIARSVGGDVRLEPPVPGAGATFVVRLPAG
ncbi:sensor histidine kinase [Xylanimonas sp. McL0601]|uniref:sensor histidine kinase n=1 Tax=Xylanimonas sp. McL0601 TaxID=3414739 RepID=UPI003CF317DE